MSIKRSSSSLISNDFLLASSIPLAVLLSVSSVTFTASPPQYINQFLSIDAGISTSDLIALAAGAGRWKIAILAVKSVGVFIAQDGGEKTENKAIAIVIGVGIAYMTTPLLSRCLGWKTPGEKVRGVALALGAAQVTDGLVHMFYPTFYLSDPNVGIACASNTFFGTGLLGIFSAYQ